MSNDLRFGFRALRRSPGFTTVAVLTLALGVGANTAVFSVVKAVLLNPLPYAEPERLVTIAETSPDAPSDRDIDYTTVARWHERSRSFESITCFHDGSGVLLESGEPEILRGLRVNYNFFDTLGVTMQLGRNFLPEEDQPGRRREIILTHGLWVRRFGADRHMIGRVLRLSQSHLTVVGVLPASFQPLIKATSELLPEMYIPLGHDALASCHTCQALRAIGRLKPGVTIEQARAELNTFLREAVLDDPTDHRRGARITAMALPDRLFGPARTALWAVLGAVAFLLLIACANVANLVLARATGRSKEMAVRAALGAGRRRLVRQALTESLLLALAGGAVGVFLAFCGTRLLASFAAAQIPRVHDTRIDAAVLAFSLAASMITGLLFGLAPAWLASRIDLNEALKSAGGAAGHRRSRLNAALVVAEFALAFVLVMGAGLMLKSFARLMNTDPGYDPRNVLTLTTNVWGPRWADPAAGLAYYRQVLERLRTTPGVESAAFTSLLPMDYTDRTRFEIEGRPVVEDRAAPLADLYSVSPDYFRVMRIAVRRGRIFNDHDSPTTPRVALVSDSFVRLHLPQEDPIGKHVRLGAGEPWLTVVGVVADVHQDGLDHPAGAALYVAETQEMLNGFYRLVARTTADPDRMVAAVRGAFMAVDNTQPVYHVKPLDGYFAGRLAERTFALAMLGVFGVLALALAAVGIYGVMSHSVALRTREVGIRIALGAERHAVVTAVLGQASVLVLAGLTLGVAASLVLTRMLASLLFQVRPTDAATSAVVAAVLASVALAASVVPARRAAHIDPIRALRDE